jgi:hypothetical protein
MIAADIMTRPGVIIIMWPKQEATVSSVVFTVRKEALK